MLFITTSETFFEDELPFCCSSQNSLASPKETHFLIGLVRKQSSNVSFITTKGVQPQKVTKGGKQRFSCWLLWFPPPPVEAPLGSVARSWHSSETSSDSFVSCCKSWRRSAMACEPMRSVRIDAGNEKWPWGQNPNRTPSEHPIQSPQKSTKMDGAPIPQWYHWC